ncbi:MAG: carbohydrate kinase family protein [Pirellulales bacterium]|nr:carbohydrate kinase family protein [Pirellulales bacterium]
MSILCIGQLVADIVVRPVDGMPFPGRTDPVGELQLLSGGCAANTAAALAKMGAAARVVAVVGTDPLGDAVLADLVAAGVELGGVIRDPSAATSACIVLIGTNGERSFLYRGGGNELLANRHVSDEVLKAARIVHVGGAMKLTDLDLADLMRRAKSLGRETSLDTDWDIHGNWMRKIERAMPNIDYFLTNEEEAAMLTGKEDFRAAAADLLARGPKAVAVKRGAHGSLLATRGGAEEFSAYRVPVFDTTCAGDSFVAGFLYGVSRGRPLDESMRLGNAAGALCTTQISHRAITGLEAVLGLMNGRAK